MDFALTDEQRALADSVRSFLRDRFGLDQVRASYEDTAGTGDPDVLRKAAADSGWLAVLVPEEHDGLGLGLLDAGVLARAFGAGVAPGSWSTTLLAGEAIRLGGSADQQATWLPRIAAAEAVATVALRGPGGSWSPAGVAVTAEGGRLTGTANHVEYAHVADVLVVAATEDDGVGLYLVAPDAAGVTVQVQDGIDRTTRLSTVTFDGATGERLTDSSAATLEGLAERGAVLAANDLAGIARTALTMTIEYDKTRQQFGRPVGSFQAIKHHLADLHVGVTMAEHAALYAGHAVDTDAADRAMAVSVAKVKASDAALATTRAMIQYFGGIGFTWEHDAHFFFKRAQRLAYAYNDSDWHLDRLAQVWLDPLPAASSVEPTGPTTSDATPTAQTAGVAV
ncbi:MAG TPA: acyl-CoA dehydrogenase family protein [Frankiaceae bacterium]